jgi:hypothetical protein
VRGGVRARKGRGCESEGVRERGSKGEGGKGVREVRE